jgi:GDPmannose 4,6-dehydratase
MLKKFLELRFEELMKKAIITGVTGQDGSYLAEYLLGLGYLVVGLKRRTSIIVTPRIDKLMDNKNFRLEYYDMDDMSSVLSLVRKYDPDEFYHLAAQSHVRVSFEVPINTVSGIVMGTLNILEVLKSVSPQCKFYFAGSSEMFGDNPENPQNEQTAFSPASPYGCAKAAAFYLTRNYRESYGMFACSGILFNHESERRGETFLTRKVTLAAARIKHGLQENMLVGNLHASRDWGYAKEYVECMHAMLQQHAPDDYVIATGVTHTVKEWIEVVFDAAGMPLEWEGSEAKEVGKDKETGKVLVRVNSKLYRPHEVNYLLGDPSKAVSKLNWKPQVKFEELAKIMYEHDEELAIIEKKIKEIKNG